MTTQTVAPASSLRTARNVLVAGLVGALAPYAAAVAWALVSNAIWGPALRISAFLDPGASRPHGYVAGSLLVAAGIGALVGGLLARLLERRPGAVGWGRWVAFAVGALLSAARVDVHALWQPVIVLLLGSSALGFRVAGRR